MNFGLKDDIIKKINAVFFLHNQVEEVIIYGSRAKGNHKPGSDIDLSIKGEDLNLKVLNKISLQLDDLLLPYTFDLSIFNKIDNTDLIEHINRAGKKFYNKSET